MAKDTFPFLNFGVFLAVDTHYRLLCMICRCDRILWYGKGLKQLEYVRGDLKLSDHRSVSATFMAEVEVVSHRKLKKACVYPKDLKVDTKVYLKFTPILAVDRMHSNEVPGGVSVIRAINYSSYMALAHVNFLIGTLVGELERLHC